MQKSVQHHEQPSSPFAKWGPSGLCPPLMRSVHRTASRSSFPRHRNRAITLVELLVVIGIILVLAGVSLTAVQPVLEGRDIREGARQLNAFLAGAQNKAISRNRPIGVWFKRLGPTNPGICLEVFVSEVPPLYVGDFVNSLAFIDTTLTGHPDFDFIDAKENLMSPDLRWSLGVGTKGRLWLDAVLADSNRVRENDFIRLNLRGPFYRISAVGSPGTPPDALSNVMASAFAIDFEHPTAPPPVAPPPTVGIPYQIRRYGIPSSSPALEFPNGVALDIRASGMGRTSTIQDGVALPLIIFDPDGSVGYVSGDVGLVRPVGMLHFLVGRPLEPMKVGANLGDLYGRWVSIGHITGTVSTAENFARPVENASNASPIVITSTNHGLATGERVGIVGVRGNTAANGAWIVTVIGANTYSLNASTGDGNYTRGGTWSSVAMARSFAGQKQTMGGR